MELKNSFDIYKTPAKAIFKDMHERMKSGDSTVIDDGIDDLTKEIEKLFQESSYKIEKENGKIKFIKP